MTEEEKKEESGEISRREFLKDAGLIVGGAAIGSTVLLAACAPEEAVTTETVTTTVTETVPKFVCPSCNQEFATLAALQSHFTAQHPAELTKLTVNGETHDLKIEPNWTLAYFLRDKLGLTGTKVSCDEGACGSCTVLIDGEPILSCMTLAVTMDGKDIVTIEGLADGPTLHPIQEAYIEEHGTQCAFCTPGFIMTTKAFLDKNQSPTVEEVKEALSGNICRCGAYEDIINSVLAAADKIRRS